jgi:hypothetical protein
MQVVRFWTKYGYRVMGGELGSIVRGPSSHKELEAPIVPVPPGIVEQYEAEHQAALDKHNADLGQIFDFR